MKLFNYADRLIAIEKIRLASKIIKNHKKTCIEVYKLIIVYSTVILINETVQSAILMFFRIVQLYK